LVTPRPILAARHTGAIIVLERQIGLRNYIEGGIPLDAMITYDLLSSIFQQASPLHDGAVIIQGDPHCRSGRAFCRCRSIRG
jgi:diadenylate cyclase